MLTLFSLTSSIASRERASYERDLARSVYELTYCSRPARNTIDNSRIMTAPVCHRGWSFISFCYGRSAWQQAPGHWSRAVYFLVQAKKFKVEFLCLHIAQMFDASAVSRFLAASALRAIIRVSSYNYILLY